MRLTEEQKNAIVDEIVKQMQTVIDDPENHVEEEFEYDDDGYEGYLNSGSHSFSRVLEEICADGLPGIDSENSEIGICVEYDGYLTFHDDSDPGDYWTPPSGGIEIDSIELTLQSLEVEVYVLNPEIGEYERIDVTDDEITTLTQTITSKIVNRPERRKSKNRRVAV